MPWVREEPNRFEALSSMRIIEGYASHIERLVQLRKCYQYELRNRGLCGPRPWASRNRINGVNPINAVRVRAEMNQRVPENNELFPTEVDARVAAARFNARNGYGRRAAAVSQHTRGWVVVICQYTPVGYLSQAESE